MIKSIRTAAAALMTAVSALALTVPGPAGAASGGVLDVTCTPPSSQNDTFTPPLTVTPRDVTVGITSQLGPCVSLSNPAITSGAINFSALVRGLSCLDLLQSGSITYTIVWNTGQTSTISANYTVTIVGAALVVTRTGTVTSGLFAGSTVLQVITGPATDVLLCILGLGTVSSTYSLVTLEITSL
ncbi:hypothetical protein B0I31_113178 [Saccharothrix carnea]|uniref:Ig-like domain-containing protein n=1 Tax=Saccharothrix carnea TaxID=1280637 RepID=A0A2P8I230_SACCR|nr:hypothetical protein [Saccharothrix carnea]PSL52505.1 hypothetical protein B0I31_113178 [Saccharothrix carnea]